MPIEDKKLQELIDKQEIQEVLARYCRGIDRSDEATIRSVYHEDAIDDHGIWKGSGFDFAAWIVKSLPSLRQSQHMIANVIIELEGDIAHCETYCVASSDDGKQGKSVYTRYLDRFEKRKGQWKIADRRVVFDLWRVEPSSDFADSAVGKTLTWGRKDKNDPLYQR